MEKLDILKRSDKLAFYGVPGEGGEYTYHRMKGFSTLSTAKNPKEYSRQYVDEESERTDVVGYSPSMSFTLDRAKDNAVHDDIISIYDNEKVGADAVRPIIIVDMTADAVNAISRNFAVIPDAEGDGTDAYVYSGTFKATGEKIVGTATSSDEWQTITFASDEVSE
jgi:hypothetical protein